MSVVTLSPDEKDLYKIVFAIRQLQEGRSNRVPCKVGTFTKNMADASGSQSYTGIGFKPAAVIFFAGVNGADGDSSPTNSSSSRSHRWTQTDSRSHGRAPRPPPASSAWSTSRYLPTDLHRPGAGA